MINESFLMSVQDMLKKALYLITALAFSLFEFACLYSL